ncbi:MAG: hypothetical protein K6E61_01170 [Bacteroidales bacterium]|nr:hypothetical protein [Bacteroidales bacterium]
MSTLRCILALVVSFLLGMGTAGAQLQQVTVTIVDNADGDRNTHKSRFEYSFLDQSGNLMSTHVKEFKTSKGEIRTFTITAPYTYSIAPAIRYQLQRRPEDDDKYSFLTSCSGTFLVSDGRKGIRVVIKGNSFTREGKLSLDKESYPALINNFQSPLPPEQLPSR